MREVCAIGVGMTRFGRYPEACVEELGRVAGQRVLRDLGLTGIPVINVENACAGGGTSFHLTWTSIAGGFYDVGIAIGLEKMSKGLIPPNPDDLDGLLGRTYPSRFAMMAQRHLHQYGITREQLGHVVR